MDIEHSKYLSEVIKAQPKECFTNSIKALFCDPTSVYCEGYCIILGGIPIQHGWLEDISGEVVDVTLWHDPPSEYFVGARYTKHFIEDWFRKSDELITPISNYMEFNYAMYKAYNSLGVDISNLLRA